MLTDAERDDLRDWWDEDETVSVESAFPIIERIIHAHISHAEKRIEGLKEMNAALREALGSENQLRAQVAGLEAMNTEKAAEIRRLRMGNHPAGRALRSLPPIAPFADALAEALTERDAEHEGGGGA